MATLVIKSFPDELHAQLKEAAAKNRRSLTQEAIRLLEEALANASSSRVAEDDRPTYWATRKLIPEFEAALKKGAFSGGTDSTESLSGDRDAR